MTTLPEQSGVTEAYALAYAAFRLASSLDNPAFRQSFEDRGIKLLLAALDGDRAMQIGIVRDMEYLVGFGRDIGSIHPQTAELMLGEIGKFNPAASENQGAVRSAVPLGVQDLFPKRTEVSVRTAQPPASMPATVADRIVFSRPAEDHREVPSENFLLRKERILERIRQSAASGNPAMGCRLRDIQELMPGLSERTLRYDLQRLVAEGAIERVGNGGPATFYRIRQ